MTELRRLLIDSCRLNAKTGIDRVLALDEQESHYLNRVLRLRCGDLIAVVDGIGHLWEASLHGKGSIKFFSSLECPVADQPCPNPLIGLAAVLPKRGIDEVCAATTGYRGTDHEYVLA